MSCCLTILTICYLTPRCLFFFLFVPLVQDALRQHTPTQCVDSRQSPTHLEDVEVTSIHIPSSTMAWSVSLLSRMKRRMRCSGGWMMLRTKPSYDGLHRTRRRCASQHLQVLVLLRQTGE